MFEVKHYVSLKKMMIVEDVNWTKKWDLAVKHDDVHGAHGIS